MRLFDTHAHLADEQFDATRGEVLLRARNADVDRLLVVGTTRINSQHGIEIANQERGVWASVGIHPNYCAVAESDDWSKIIELITHAKVVALGETGLDRHWDDSPFALQQEFFERHIHLSQQTGLPLIVHMRECEADVLEMFRRAATNGPLLGVMHSFTGSQQGAEEFLRLGLYLSFAGMVTFKKSAELRQIAQLVPADRILLETDSPYLTPEPFRGRRPNEPCFLTHTARCLAEVRSVSVEQLAEQTTANALRLFSRIPVTHPE